MKNGLSYSISGSPSSNEPGAASQASSEGVSGRAAWFCCAWLVVAAGSSGVSPLVAGASTSIAVDDVDSDGGWLATSGSGSGPGVLASRYCWLAVSSLACLFSFSFWNFFRCRARCASVLTFIVDLTVVPDVPGTGVGPRLVPGSATRTATTVAAVCVAALGIVVCDGLGVGCCDGLCVVTSGGLAGVDEVVDCTLVDLGCCCRVR